VNERITLLALKASDSKTGWLDRQKFAELIVQECAKVILETSVQYNEIDTMHRIRDNVKAHFGVEE
jgi:hypothetical protein